MLYFNNIDSAKYSHKLKAMEHIIFEGNFQLMHMKIYFYVLTCHCLKLQQEELFYCFHVNRVSVNISQEKNIKTTIWKWNSSKYNTSRKMVRENDEVTTPGRLPVLGMMIRNTQTNLGLSFKTSIWLKRAKPWVSRLLILNMKWINY